MHVGSLAPIIASAEEAVNDWPPFALPRRSGDAVTMRLPSRLGEGRRLLRACADLERRHGLRIAVRHTGERDTYAVSFQRGGAACERQ